MMMKRKTYKRRAAIHGLSMAVFLGACLGVQANDNDKGVSAQATVNTDSKADYTSDRNVGDRVDRNDSGNLSHSDADFVKEAAQGGWLEVRMGQTAKDHGSSADVKDYGEMLVKDHIDANAKLHKLAAAKGVNLAKQMEPKHTGMIKDMEDKSGAEFDRAFIRHAISDHKKDINKFEKASRDLEDAELRSFAADTLPTLRQHLDKAQQIARSLGIDVNVTDASEYGYDNNAAAAGAASVGAPGLNVQAENSSVNRTDNAKIDVDVDHDHDAKISGDVDIDHPSAEGKVEVDTDKGDGKTLGIETRPGDNKTLGIETEKGDNEVLGIKTVPGDGKTLGLNTRKDDGKLLGVFPAPGAKKAENRVDVDVDDSDHSVDVDASVGAPASSEKGAKVDAEVEHHKDYNGKKYNADLKVMTYNDVPSKVQETIRAQGGSNQTKNIKRHMMNGKTVYKVEIEKDGRNRMLEIAEDGTIIKDNNK